jgi:hypothetical protein
MGIKRINRNTIEITGDKKNAIREIETLVMKDIKPVQGNFDFLKSPRKRDPR